MARTRRFAQPGMLWPQSMGWWGLAILVIAGCRGVLAADSAATEPSAAASRGEEGGCYRPLSDVIWGFLVTLLALTVSAWGSMKHRDTRNKLDAILAGVFGPHMELSLIVDYSLWCVSMLWICHKLEYPDSRITSPSWLRFLCTSLFPWSKSPVRILASCDIVVYVSKESPLLQKEWLWNSRCLVEDESEAMVVGENGARRLRDHQYERKELSVAGVGLLVWKEVFCKARVKRLPAYGELKYLRGNSGFAIIAVAVQAIGYIYAVGFRMAKNLRITPVEVIGLVLNIILLMKVFFYSTCNSCHRPLVIYMDEDWEQEVGEFHDNDQEKLKWFYSSDKILLVLFCGYVLVLSTLLIYYILNIVKATNVMVGVPIISFLLGLWLFLFGFLAPEKYDKISNSFPLIAFLLIAMSYIWALVGTVLYWKTMHFNVRGDFINLSQIIPFIG